MAMTATNLSACR